MNEPTTRNQFAMAALPGVIIAFRRYAEERAMLPGNGSVNDIFASIAFATADAMILRSQKHNMQTPSVALSVLGPDSRT